MSKFIITKDVVKNIRRFGVQGRTLHFNLKPVPVNEEEPLKWVKDAIEGVVKHATEGLQENDQVGFSFCSNDFKRGDGWIRFRPLKEVTLDDLWEVIGSVYQSNSSSLSSESFCLGVTSVRLPFGRGNNRGKYNTFNEECGKRRGIATISNVDNLCLPRALIVAIAYVDKLINYNKIRRDTGKIQTQQALDLIKKMEIIIAAEGAGIMELAQFQKYLCKYRIVVYEYGSKGRNVIFEGACESNKKLNLLYHDGHFNVITSLTAAFGCIYYCDICHIPYNNKNDHRCGGTCPACQQTPACKYDMKVKCINCHREFRGQICYENHKRSHSLGKSTVCEQITRCNQCMKVTKSTTKHLCGDIFCKICNTRVPETHLCYIQTDKGKPKLDNFIFIFYDLETRQELVLDDGSQLHEPNLCVFKQVCNHCLDNDVRVCEKCGLRLQIIKCEDPVSSFMHFILELRKKFKNVVVLAHNGQAFDHQFILNYILTKTDIKPQLIMRGTKIICMEVQNVKFLDSLNYFPMKLSELPQAFGLPVSLKKGYFPHLFNKIAHGNYIGTLPPVEFYSPDMMREEERKVFLQWYETNRNNDFDINKELIEYCISDVEILTQACLKFRKQLLDVGNVCPFTEACTIASTCNKLYRRNFLEPNVIGVIPRNGYRWRDNQSKVAIKWLLWEERERGINILHAAKQNEVKINGMKVDGYCTETRQVFEFSGCYYHGCPSCFTHKRDEPLHNNHFETLNSRLESTKMKVERLKAFGYEVIEKWECQFRRELNNEMRSLTENHPLLDRTPLNPRDAFFGGRCGNTRTYYKVKDDEKINYIDVCSLYPWVCKLGRFPIGHPTVYVGTDCNSLNLAETDGFIKCRILPPQNLYHPVLPMKMNNKLMFVLCQICGESMNVKDCMHNQEERSLKGTWTLEEVNKAISIDYKLLEIYEVWAYKTIQFDKTTRKAGLFTEMMNRFIKIKQEASGWPGTCITQEQKDEYIKKFFEIEDVKLEFSEIINNPGLRSFAKLILNSFWGKFGQRENQPKTQIINDSGEFFSLLVNPSLVVNGVIPVNETTLIVNYVHKEDTFEPLNTVNVAIASYVTAQARLKLYSFLEQLGMRTIYYDTDSVIYISKDGDVDIPTGEFIGDMTNELATYGPGSYITEFVSGGPKNYAFSVFSTNKQTEVIVCKVKGISLNFNASQIVNFKSMKEMVLHESEPVHIISKNIRRTTDHRVVTREEIKTYRPHSTKRKFSADYSSLPYGFKTQKKD